MPRQSIGDLTRKALDDPESVIRKVDSVMNKAIYIPLELLFHYRYSTDGPIINEDWDNLIILDACRFDSFQDQNSIDGELHAKLSTSSHSAQFIDSNFVGRTLHDTVYVTGNPHMERVGEDVFHALYPVEAEKVGDQSDYPGPHLQETAIVRPEDVVETAVKAHEKHPNKRLIVHFMQPHHPFIGETGQEIEQSVLESDKTDKYINEGRWVKNIQSYDTVYDSDISVSSSDIVSAYQENLEIVLKYAKGLLTKLDGSSVITADHGELLGERVYGKQRYGHPPEIPIKELREVPWLEIDGDRRRIKSDPPIKSNLLQEPQIEEQLAALGYR